MGRRALRRLVAFRPSLFSTTWWRSTLSRRPLAVTSLFSIPTPRARFESGRANESQPFCGLVHHQDTPYQLSCSDTRQAPIGWWWYTTRPLPRLGVFLCCVQTVSAVYRGGPSLVGLDLPTRLPLLRLHTCVQTYHPLTRDMREMLTHLTKMDRGASSGGWWGLRDRARWLFFGDLTCGHLASNFADGTATLQ